MLSPSLILVQVKKEMLNKDTTTDKTEGQKIDSKMKEILILMRAVVS